MNQIMISVDNVHFNLLTPSPLPISILEALSLWAYVIPHVAGVEKIDGFSSS